MATITGGNWTYSGNPAASDKDAVRFLTQDTDETDQKVSDEEIEWSLADKGSVKATAAALCRNLALLFAAEPKSKTVGDLAITYGERTVQYLKLAKILESERPGIMPQAGGISESDKQTTRDNTDRVEPYHFKGQFDVNNQGDESDQDIDYDLG